MSGAASGSVSRCQEQVGHRLPVTSHAMADLGAGGNGVGGAFPHPNPKKK